MPGAQETIKPWRSQVWRRWKNCQLREVNEKRRRNDIDKGTKLPERLALSMDSELPHRQADTQAQPISSGNHSAPGTQQQTADIPMREAQLPGEKYRLRSELRESITIEQ
jgi:hypothetical protein